MDVSLPATLTNPVRQEKRSNPFLTATIISFARVCVLGLLDDGSPTELGLGFHATPSLFEAFRIRKTRQSYVSHRLGSCLALTADS